MKNSDVVSIVIYVLQLLMEGLRKCGDRCVRPFMKPSKDDNMDDFLP